MSHSLKLNKGILHMLAATFFFSMMNVCIKKISHIPPMETTFFRCLVSMLFCFAIISKDKLDWKGSNRIMLIARGLAGTTAVVTFIITLQHMPLAPAVTIQYTSPIFTTLIAVFILNERVRWFQFVFFSISFLGVILIKGFNGNISIGYLTLGLFSACCSAIAYNLVRSLKEKEHPIGSYCTFNWWAPSLVLQAAFLTGGCLRAVTGYTCCSQASLPSWARPISPNPSSQKG